MNKVEKSMPAVVRVVVHLIYHLETYIRAALIIAGVVAFGAVLVYANKVDSKYHCGNGGLAVVVNKDDTLRGIAEKYCTGSTATAVDDLVKKYGSTEIYPGQQLWLSSKP